MLTTALLLFACAPATAPTSRPDLSGGTAPGADTATPADTAPPVDTATPADTAPPPDSGDTGGTPSPQADCDPELIVERAHLLEGDTARVSARCRGQGWTVTPLALPDGGLWNGAQLTWLTGPDDAGTVELVFELRPDDPAVFPETATAELSIADNYLDPDNVPPDPMTYTEEWGLPVIHVSPQGAISQDYGPATVTFAGVRYQAEIQIRGAASASYTKNSYTLNFGAENLDTDGWLPDKKDHLILVTTMDDNSYVRQKLAYDLWASMADYWELDRLTPRTFFAVLYLNGEYHGLYTAVDRIDEEFLGELGLSRSANLYKAVDHDANYYLKPNLHAGYEKKEGADLGDFTDLDALVSFTGGSTTEEFLAGADDWLQLEEFMDWNLFVHFAAADDSGGKNAYLYNDPTDWMFRYVPWDFNQAFGQDWQTLRVSASVNNDFRSTNAIFNHIQSDPDTDDALWGRLHDMMDGGPMDPEVLRGELDDYYALIDDSAARDWGRWGQAYQDYWYWARGRCGDCLDYEGEKQYVYNWLAERDTWMRTYHP